MASIVAACLNPPATKPSESTPPWILLDTRVYLAHHDDATTAAAKTSRGHTIQISIRLADPPALSHVYLHCPDLQDDNFAQEPCVVRSEKGFLLLHLPFNWSTRFVRRSSEYCMYRAVPGKPPVLSPVPAPPTDCFLVTQDLGIHCCNDDDGEYILAGLCPRGLTGGLSGYELHLYSSVSRAWTRKPACLMRPPLEKHLPAVAHKVIPLGGSLLGWVDLWKGMLVCDVLADVPSQSHNDPLDEYEHYGTLGGEDYEVPVRFVPLPGLLPGNQGGEHNCPWMVRDITCTNGTLRLIEVEVLTERNMVKETMVTDDESCFVEPTKDPPRRYVGWRYVIWSRTLSDNGWRRVSDVHARDITVMNPRHSALLSELGRSTVGMMNLVPSFPTLSIHGDELVQMNCTHRWGIRKAQMISIDTRNKTLKTLGPSFPSKVDDFCTHFPSVLSSYMGNTPALHQIVQASNSEDVTENQRLTYSADQQVVGAPNQAHNAVPQAVQESNFRNRAENERLRSCAQEVINVPNLAHNGGSNFDLSLAPHQSFGLSGARTSYNDNPYGCADFTLPSYDNWQQSLPLQQQPNHTRPSNDNYQRSLALHQQPGYTCSSYHNYQQSFALQQQPSYLSNWLDISPRSLNPHPVSPVFNTAIFGQMVHPSPVNNYHLFQPPSQTVALPTPFRTSSPSTPQTEHGRPMFGSNPRRPQRHSPYERSAK